MRELLHELHTEAQELVLLDQLVQVNTEQFEGDAHVVTERKRIEHVNDIHRVVLILFA